MQTNNYQFQPKVSVSIPVYNIEVYIIKCLDSSIINQTFMKLKLFCK